MDQKLQKKLLSIIVPVYNEEKTIITLLNKMKNITLEKFNYEVIVINDGSTDSTLNLLQNNTELFNKLINLQKNKGKGYAIKIGLENSSGEYILFQDADLEYNPENIKDFIRLINKVQNADIILGSRFNYKNFTRSHNFYNKLGNIFITNFFNLLFSTTFTDIYSCYLCFKKKLLNVDELKCHGFEQQAEILCKITKNGNKFYEVPIDYDGRGYDEGKKIKFYDIFFVIFQIIKGRFVS